MTGALSRWLLALGALVAAWTMLGIPAHATYGARTSADEPQYLLTAISLGRDGDLDISDELADEAYRPFHGVDIDPQTYALDDGGRQISPHDPLLPVLLAVPMRLGGWVAAKATLAVVAGLLAMLTAWTAVRRFGVRRQVAVPVVAAFACTAPLATYATQVYPEIPAALAVVAAIAAITTPRPRLGSSVVVVLAVVALPWLSIKYAPVAASLVVLGLWRWRHRRAATGGLVVVLVVAGALYLAAHRAVYGGWTSYATGDHFSEAGELSVIGSAPNYLGRSRRLVGLLVDDGFGIAAWMVGWLALPFAVGAIVRRRVRGAGVLLLPLAVGWSVATFVALTMHGWWWPGRQLVCVLPLGVIAIAVTLEAVSARARAVARAGAVIALVGALTWLWTTIEAISRRHVLIVDFDHTSNPWMRVWRLVLPDGRHLTAADQLLTVAWIAIVVGVFLAGTRAFRSPGLLQGEPLT